MSHQLWFLGKSLLLNIQCQIIIQNHQTRWWSSVNHVREDVKKTRRKGAKWFCSLNPSCNFDPLLLLETWFWFQSWTSLDDDDPSNEFAPRLLLDRVRDEWKDGLRRKEIYWIQTGSCGIVVRRRRRWRMHLCSNACCRQFWIQDDPTCCIWWGWSACGWIDIIIVIMKTIKNILMMMPKAWFQHPPLFQMLFCVSHDVVLDFMLKDVLLNANDDDELMSHSRVQHTGIARSRFSRVVTRIWEREFMFGSSKSSRSRGRGPRRRRCLFSTIMMLRCFSRNPSRVFWNQKEDKDSSALISPLGEGWGEGGLRGH